MKKIFSYFIFFFLCTPFCFAVTDDTRVRMQVGLDTTAPTTPSLVTVIPVAQTQIDLTWTASTDNILLSGYQVFRDAVQIATTTLTSYSDSGLVASTSYTYFIRAFDSGANISSSSQSISTTTFSNVVTPVASSTSSSGADMTLELRSFAITALQTSIEMNWQTSRYARFELRWGRTSSYELGFVTNELYKKEHKTVISDLLSGTTYEYELVGFNKDGKKTVLKTGQFKTNMAPDSTAPTNVSNLKATVDGNNVLITWDNPQDVDFSHVRIVRSHLFYPQDPSNGFIAYSDTENSFYDNNTLQDYSKQYYSVFSYDTNGNISSGAVVMVRKNGVPVSSDEILSNRPATSTASGTSPAITFQFSDIKFTQEGVEVDATDIDALVPLIVRVPYAVFPEHLKTITVTFTHPQDPKSTFSYLLRINKDKSYYEAVLAPLRVEGIYPVELSMYDHTAQKLYAVQDTVQVQKKVKLTEIAQYKDVVTESFFLIILGFVVISIFLLWVFIILLRKMRRW